MICNVERIRARSHRDRVPREPSLEGLSNVSKIPKSEHFVEQWWNESVERRLKFPAGCCKRCLETLGTRNSRGIPVDGLVRELFTDERGFSEFPAKLANFRPRINEETVAFDLARAGVIVPRGIIRNTLTTVTILEFLRRYFECLDTDEFEHGGPSLNRRVRTSIKRTVRTSSLFLSLERLFN